MASESIREWLDAEVKAGYGAKFASAFEEVGIEDKSDLQDMDDELMALKQRALPDAQKKLPETTTAPEAPAEEEDKPIIPPVSNIGMFGKMK